MQFGDLALGKRHERDTDKFEMLVKNGDIGLAVSRYFCRRLKNALAVCSIPATFMYHSRPGALRESLAMGQ